MGLSHFTRGETPFQRQLGGVAVLSSAALASPLPLVRAFCSVLLNTHVLEYNLPCSDPFIASIAAICVRFEFEMRRLVLLGAMGSSERVSSTRKGFQVNGGDL